MSLRYGDANSTRFVACARTLALAAAMGWVPPAAYGEPATPAGSPTAAETSRAADTVSAAEQSVMDADRAFAAQAQREGRGAAFLAWMGERPTLFREGAAPLEGREAVAASVAKWKTLNLDWHPLRAEVAASGDLGYTWGEYIAKGEDAQGKPFEDHGRYVTIWRRQEGAWRWVLDIGN